MAQKTPDKIQQALKTIIDQFDKDELPVRDPQIRMWKKLELYWSGFSRIWWDETAHDWRIFDPERFSDNQDYYDKPVNVYRAFLETIIAALSATVPPIHCVPDDAENADDITTARGGDAISRLVYMHNDAPLLWCKALWTYCTQGMMAAYNYTDTDSKYGEVEVNEYKEEEQEIEETVCPLCGGPISAETSLQEETLFDPGDENVLLANTLQEGMAFCATCVQAVNPEIRKSKIPITRLVGKTKEPKSRQCIEVLGGLFVKVPNYARCQADIPYLAYEYETHYTNVYAKYPQLRKEGKTAQDVKFTSASGNDLYERWGRLSPQYMGMYPLDTPTCRNWWLRPSAFEIIADDDVREDLKKRYPDGCKCVFVNDQFAEACNENLDDHWTIVKNPLSEYLHYDPLGLLLVSIQDITQELLSLTLQTVEQGMPQTFADPSVLDFVAYQNSEITPGAVYPAKPKSGKTLAEGFHTISTAQLSKEVGPFAQRIQELGQFVSGALPSLFGGTQPSSSRTAAQYSMSRNQALQRLQTTWKMVNYWWSDIFAKVIPQYIKTMTEDERFVQAEQGSYINVWIRTAQLQGRIGSVECESADELPLTFGQIKDAVMQLFTLNNPEVLAALSTPENLGLLRQALGLNNFHVPGEKDRVKQFSEIQQLLAMPPYVGPDGTEIPSIMPDIDVDNHIVEAEVCRSWLVGDAGRLAKVENQAGYKNVLLHMKAHVMMIPPPPQVQEPKQNSEKLKEPK